MAFNNGVGPLERLNSLINNSATMTENAGVNIIDPAHKAVMYDTDGNVVIATSGEAAIGVILSSSFDPIYQGRQVHFLIKNIGLISAGGAINKGDLITINATGQAVVAGDGDFIFGRAFTAATVADEAVQAQINQMGFMPAS